MRKCIAIVMLFVALQGTVFSADIPGQGAIDAFLKTQNDILDLTLNAQISELRRSGYRRMGVTTAVYLAGGCGVAGCLGTYLVTTSYSQTHVNPQSKVVAAIVSETEMNRFQVSRILTRVEIDSLLGQK